VFPAIPDIFTVNVLGYQTHRDDFAIALDQSELERRIKALVDKTQTDLFLKQEFGLADNSSWNIADARAALAKADRATKGIIRTLYRPFDVRWCHYGYELMDRPRKEIIAHVVGRQNLQLLVPRQVSGDWKHACVSDLVVESCVVSSKTKEQNYTFPLYRYPPPADAKPRKADLFGDASDPFAGKKRVENLAPAFRQWLNARLGRHHAPEAVLGYIYAVLHAPAYRIAYAEFLRSGFPRIPFPEDDAAFASLAALGAGLMEAHLLRTVPKRGLGGFEGKGDQRVEAVRYSPVDRCIRINATQGFADVTLDVWQFTIGSYQVLDKYLKTRRYRVLTLDEIENVEAVVNILAFTIERMAEIELSYCTAFPEIMAEKAPE